MRVIVFGSTGMIGQGVLRECLRDAEVEGVLTIVRTPSGETHDKVCEIVHGDFYDWSGLTQDLAAYDACLFCLGVSSAGMGETDYHRVTYELTLGAARALVERNPRMTFVYVSGAGTDSTEKGRTMWARVKGTTENALLALPFESSYMVRPAFIQPMHGIKAKAKLYRVFYALSSPFYPLWKVIAPTLVTTTEDVGKAMIEIAKHGAEKRVLENDDLNAIARGRAREKSAA